MRLCLFGPGDSIHMQKWANFFARGGHSVHLICWRFSDDLDFDDSIRIHKIRYFVRGSHKHLKYLNLVPWVFQIRKLLRTISPDVLDAHSITHYGCIATLLGYRPRVLTAWGSDILLVPKQSKVDNFLTSYCLKKADKIVCDSETVRANILDLGVPESKIVKIYNGIDVGRFSPSADNNVRSILGVPTDTSLVICTRNLEWIYNHRLFFDAIPEILKRHPETLFIIGGKGSLRESLLRLAVELGVRDVVKFIGLIPQEELPKYLASSDVYVSTSVSDSTSLSLQEAMACELAPVVTDLAANREWVENEVNGFLVPLDDASALADRVAFLLQNESIRREFGKRCRQLIVREADYYKEMRKAERLYASLTRDEV